MSFWSPIADSSEALDSIIRFISCDSVDLCVEQVITCIVTGWGLFCAGHYTLPQRYSFPTGKYPSITCVFLPFPGGIFYVHTIEKLLHARYRHKLEIQSCNRSFMFITYPRLCVHTTLNTHIQMALQIPPQELLSMLSQSRLF